MRRLRHEKGDGLDVLMKGHNLATVVMLKKSSFKSDQRLICPFKGAGKIRTTTGKVAPKRSPFFQRLISKTQSTIDQQFRDKLKLVGSTIRLIGNGQSVAHSARPPIADAIDSRGSQASTSAPTLERF
jgi:hypothetical protein